MSFENLGLYCLNLAFIIFNSTTIKRLFFIFLLTSIGIISKAQNDTLVFLDFSVVDSIPLIVGEPTGLEDGFWINYDQDTIGDQFGRPAEWYFTPSFSSSDSSNTVLTSSSWLSDTSVRTSNYFISPKLHFGDGGGVLSWHSAPRQAPQYLDGYMVLISTTDNMISSFQDTLFKAAEYVSNSADSSGSSPIRQFDWFDFSQGWIHGQNGLGLEFDTISDSTSLTGTLLKNEVDLSNYANQSIHIAFCHNSKNDNLISIDDILVIGSNAASVHDLTFSNSLELYPNPTSDMLNVSFDIQKVDNLEIEITDAVGRTVFRERIGELAFGNKKYMKDVSFLPSGQYHFTLHSAGTSYTKSFVIL